MKKIYLFITFLLISYLVVFSLGFFSYYFYIKKTIEENTIEINDDHYEKIFGSRYSSANIVAVTNQGEGVLGHVNVELREGQGRVLMNTNPFTEPDIQFSIETASKVAQDFTKTSTKDKDTIISFDVQSKLIGGQSAGAAITSAIIAAIQGRNVKKDVAVTGTIEKNGEIGKVSGIPEKMQAASEQEVKTFLLPKGQKYLTIYELKTKTEKKGGFIIQRRYYVPITIDLEKFGKEELNMTVIEVQSIGEVIKYLLE